MMELNVLKLKPGQVKEIERSTEVVEAEFAVDSGDNGILLMLKTEAEGYVTVHAGDGVFAGKDMVINVAPEGEKIFYLESGRFMNHTGEHKGKIYLTCDEESMQALAVQLV